MWGGLVDFHLPLAPSKGDHTLNRGVFPPPTRRQGACAQNGVKAKCRDHLRLVHLAASHAAGHWWNQDPVAGRTTVWLPHTSCRGPLPLLQTPHRTCDAEQ